MSEHLLWERIRGGMGPRWDAQRHEDKYSTGIPDVSYGCRGRDGWIELKYLEKEPAPRTRSWDFRYSHFTAEQRNWLTRRMERGSGRLFLLAQMGDNVYLWRWRTLSVLLGNHTFDHIRQAAEGQWRPGPIDYQQLTVLLSSRYT